MAVRGAPSSGGSICSTVIVSIIPFVGIFVALAALIPVYAAMARRLHDTDRSGWWILAPAGPAILGGGILAAAFASNPDNPDTTLAILGGVCMLVALVLGIMLLVWLASDSQPGPNRFGPSPK